ncbi:vWA domain-containing protein [Actinoplanes sp. CA-252034]|uniref:vWA domain-containing protein n=1 Tax=Actinoplanes sp. CA-252034 TaxID=3239906 RepID=UPI003D958AA2
MDFRPRLKEDNPDPRIACALLLDTSASMAGGPINALNQGLELFCDEIKKDELAQKRAEITVISFGGGARVEIPFTEGRDLQPRTLMAAGDTPMGAALNLGLEQLQHQKQAYRQAGLEYYRPWLFLLTDGEPTDEPVFASAAEHVRQVEAAKGVAVFPIGVGPYVNVDRLRRVSGERTPVMLEGLSFREFFQWLSASLSAASASNAFGSSDSAGSTEQIPLPSPQGWAQV